MVGNEYKHLRRRKAARHANLTKKLTDNNVSNATNL